MNHFSDQFSIDFGSIFDRFWGGFWNDFGWGPNSIPKAIQNLIDFWIDFGVFIFMFSNVFFLLRGMWDLDQNSASSVRGFLYDVAYFTFHAVFSLLSLVAMHCLVVVSGSTKPDSENMLPTFAPKNYLGIGLALQEQCLPKRKGITKTQLSSECAHLHEAHDASEMRDFLSGGRQTAYLALIH